MEWKKFARGGAFGLLLIAGGFALGGLICWALAGAMGWWALAS